MSVNSIAKQDVGFTLIEMMVALFILSVSILALTSVTITSMKVNMENDARNAALRVTSEVTEYLLTLNFEDPDLAITAELDPPDPKTKFFPVDLRGVKKDFTVTWTVAEMSATLKRIDITVRYDIRGNAYTNQSVVYRPSET